MILLQSLPIATQAKYLLTDSRKLLFPAESIFFAICGQNFDGHDFIIELIRKGVFEFVVEKNKIQAYQYSEIDKISAQIKILEVDNVLKALQQIATAKRNKVNIPIIGITGSNGKTIIKEWLSSILAQQFKIAKSPKSYNSQLGVPLSVWQLNEYHTLGIFEAGISKVGEMANLGQIIKPTLGIFTNIGTAHDEFFESKYEKVAEKIKLFLEAKTLIYCIDYNEIEKAVTEILIPANKDCLLLGWTKKNTAEHNFTFIKDNLQTKITYCANTTTSNFVVPFVDEASLENICHCIVAATFMGFSPATINNRLHELKAIAMRLEMKEGVKASFLIDDSYNNDIFGLEQALNFQKQQKQKNKKVVILSDLLQSSSNPTDLYIEIASLLKKMNVNLLVAVGYDFKANKNLFPENSIFMDNTDQFIQKFDEKLIENSVVLVKGARKFNFERIISKLQLKTHETVFEVNLDALTHNLNYFRNKIGKNTKVMVMVKAFAYGAGNTEVASLLQFHGVDYLGVAYADEGVMLRKNGIYMPIMVMNCNHHDFSIMEEYELEPEIFSKKILDEYIDFVSTNNTFTKVHIKLDTGMHRLGFEESDIDYLIDKLKQNPNIIVASIFSHLAASEDKKFNDFTLQQVTTFNKYCDKIANNIGYMPTRHILNSSGILQHPSAKMEMVRLGIGLYGIAPDTENYVKLKVVGTLKTIVSQIKYLTAGDTVGYGLAGKILKNTTIATIAIGYADGYDRRLGNGVGKVLINNKLCPTIGNICMDMTMVDISNVDTFEGDKVTIFGEALPIDKIAKDINTSPYELLTGISERVKRVFYSE